MSAPRFNSQISLGNVIQIGAFIAALAGGWAIMDQRSQANDARINRVESESAAMEVRIRVLEVTMARSSEQLSNIMSLLNRIDGRLERIERKP